MSSPFPFESVFTWYQKYGRHDLPWREFHQDEKIRAYHVWLSEILLQQTQVERVIDFYKRIILRFPTIEILAETDYDTFFPYYQGLGYYSRARNLLKTAKIISKEYAGMFPKETKELMALPGIGAYTAEAIRAFAFDIPTLAFDTNLHQVFAKHLHGSSITPLSKEEQQRVLQEFLSSGYSARDMNAALMDYANSLFTKEKKKPKTKRQYFPIKDAKVVVILHENHQYYFSLNKKTYTPFILDPNEEENRKYIQEYFKYHYHLLVSVRPIHKKEYRNNEPYVFVYAQIQSGNHHFYSYLKHDTLSFLETFLV